MGITFYLSDTHGAGVTEQVFDIANYLSDNYNQSANIVDAGDKVDLFKEFQNMSEQQKKELLIEQQSVLDNIIGQYPEINYFYINGNSDPGNLQNGTCITDKLVEIEGKNHLGIENHVEGPFQGRSDIPLVLSKVEQADYVITHSPPLSDKQYRCEKSSPDLEETIKKTEPTVVCGHVHGSEFREYGKNGFLSRVGISSDVKDTSLMVRVNDDKGDNLYKVKTSDIGEIATWINPEKEYKGVAELQKQQIQMQERAVNQYISQNYPDLPERKRSIIERQNEIMNEADVSDQKGFMDYLNQNHPELVNEIKEIQKKETDAREEAIQNLKSQNSDISEQNLKKAV
ncbi:MAG: hypothetical protein ACQER9_03655 [Nanobdellota archaeon]